MKVIDRILYRKVVSGDTEETNQGSQQGLSFKLKNYKPYDFYKAGSAMPENKRFNGTHKKGNNINK